MSTGTTPSNIQDLTIPGLLLILRRRRLFIIITVFLCFSLTVLLCLFMTRRYEATGEIEVDKQSSDELGLEGMKGDGSSSDALEENIALQTQADILQSDRLALTVIKTLGLESTTDFQPKFNPISWVLDQVSPAGPRDPSNVPLDEAPVRRTRALKVFARHLTVKPIGGTRLISITYIDSNPQLSAAVVNQLMKGLVDYSFQTRYDATTEASHWLAGQMDELKQQAEDLQATVVQLQREAGVYSLGTVDSTGKDVAYSAPLDRLQQSTEALTQATSNRILKESIYDMVKRGNPEMITGLSGTSLSGASPGVNSSFNLLQNLRAQQAAAEVQLAADSSKYGIANPKLEDDNASLVGINAAIKQEVKRIGERAENDYRAAQIAEDDLRADYQKQRAAADQVNDKAVKYSIAQQEAAESRQLYETLYQHLKEAGVIDGLRSSNITVVNPGRVPAKPATPNVPVYLGLSFFGSLFLGSVGALFLDSMDDRVQSMDIIEQTLNTPLLAVIPSAGGAMWRREAELSYPKRLRRLPQLTTISSSQPTIVAPDTSRTAFTESLRGLRTALLLARSSSPPKVIVITSPAESEGKTTISLHLAAVLVRNHSKVLLVEGDMRCPTLARRTCIPEDRGLSNLLSGDQEILASRPFVDLPELAIIPAGPTPPYPAELLGSQRMNELLERWSQEFDFILIDSPSVLAVTDATILSKMADITLLVARHAQSTRKSVDRAWQILHVNSDTKIGVVLNGVNRGSPAYSEYFGYHGNGYYGTTDGGAHV